MFKIYSVVIILLVILVTTTPVQARSDGAEIAKGLFGAFLNHATKNQQQEQPTTVIKKTNNKHTKIAQKCLGPYAPDGDGLSKDACGTHEDKIEIQKLLKTLGYYSSTIDGAFGRGSQRAVMAWERDNSNEQDGYISDGEKGLLIKQVKDIEDKNRLITEKKQQKELERQKKVAEAKKEEDKKKVERRKISKDFTDEKNRLKQQGITVHEFSPSDAIKATVAGDTTVLIKGDYYIPNLIKTEAHFSGQKIVLPGYKILSNYEVSQIVDDYVMYQNYKDNLTPILLEKEPDKLYLKGQRLHLATSLYEYVGPKSYTNITGSSTQALVFRPVKNKKITNFIERLKHLK